MVTVKRQEYLKRYREANRERLASEDRARYAASREARALAGRAYRESHKAEIVARRLAYREANLERIREHDRTYYEATKEIRTARIRQYKKQNAATVAASNRGRQAAKSQRTPVWLTPDDWWLMRQAYELARLRTTMFGFPWHVDHIYPLQGKTVSGLHVPTNLQVIPATENCRKNNKC